MKLGILFHTNLRMTYTDKILDISIKFNQDAITAFEYDYTLLQTFCDV